MIVELVPKDFDGETNYYAEGGPGVDTQYTPAATVRLDFFRGGNDLTKWTIILSFDQLESALSGIGKHNRSFNDTAIIESTPLGAEWFAMMADTFSLMNDSRGGDHWVLVVDNGIGDQGLYHLNDLFIEILRQGVAGHSAAFSSQFLGIGESIEDALRETGLSI